MRLRDLMTIAESVANDLVTNDAIEERLRGFTPHDQMLLRDSIDAVISAGQNGTSLKRWVEFMKGVHPDVELQTLRTLFRVMTDTFKDMIEIPYSGCFRWRSVPRKPVMPWDAARSQRPISTRDYHLFGGLPD